MWPVPDSQLKCSWFCGAKLADNSLKTDFIQMLFAVYTCMEKKRSESHMSKKKFDSGHFCLQCECSIRSLINKPDKEKVPEMT